MRGSVATGHPLTSSAAGEMLSLGGNAFDAAIAAGFASVVTEPALTSLGGGGFLLAHIKENKEDVLFDFFVNTPGLNGESGNKPEMTPVDIKFPQCTQVFHTGFASAAVPGMLKGLLHVHKRLCTLPLRTILSPALMYLDSGVVVTDLQGYFLSLLRPIFASTSYGKGVYTREGRYVRREDRLFNPLLREYFQLISDGNADMYSGKLARTLVEEVRSQKGVITLSDLEAYEVVERSPLRIRYGDREIIINPPPSSGGIKLALGLNLFEQVAAKGLGRDSVELLVIITEIMKKMNDFNPLQNERGRYGSSHDSPISAIIDSFRKELSETTFIANQGTTQISIIDEDGNAVSMTTSNGSGSGCFIPGTGVMLNNMMGEDDLHPDGFFSSQPGKRVSSMMAPTITLREGKVETALGSGGSKRIRNAIFQVLINMIEYGNSLEKAVESSRIHYEDDILHAEPGIASGIIEQLSRKYRVNIWDRKDVYFGGVHCVNSDMDGWGDSRRGGNFLRL